MVTVRKMRKEDIPVLFEIALRAFQPDFEQYGVYPPLINIKKKRFLPPLLFGKTILSDDEVAGGAFVVALGKKGEIGSIFIDPAHQHKGIGRQAVQQIEALHPNVRQWKLDVLAESKHLHAFYESLGYVKTGEMADKKSGLSGFIYEKKI